ncbi:hypothetical protein ABDK56_12745 [Sphingomonas sp. ASV193]|uniref:hypothetical protein n=1 Tax=Sphingomonas sp. ASV193 TaxID=3144405 RepID=UPI0032E8BD74
MLRVPRTGERSRHFLFEVAIVVIGVLIALVANEVVQARDWASQVGDARQTMDEQLYDMRIYMLERIKVSACIARRLDQLDAEIDKERVGPVNLYLGAPYRPFQSSSWEAASASGAIAHFDPGSRSVYANLFGFGQRIQKLNEDEFDSWNSVRTIQNHPQMDSISRDRLAAAISAARSENRMLTVAARQWLDQSLTIDLRLKPDDRRINAAPVKCLRIDQVRPDRHMVGDIFYA